MSVIISRQMSEAVTFPLQFILVHVQPVRVIQMGRGNGLFTCIFGYNSAFYSATRKIILQGLTGIYGFFHTQRLLILFLSIFEN